jgi:hypothetical protein
MLKRNIPKFDLAPQPFLDSLPSLG